MRFRFIEAEKARFPVGVLCTALQVSRSGFYAWSRRAPSSRAQANHSIEIEIAKIHDEMKERYGSPRMHRELVARGFLVGRHRVARLMRRANIRARRRRAFVLTTTSDHTLAVAPNIVNRNFHSSQPDRIWAGDITYIPTREGWLYLAVLIDLHSRFVVGWSTSVHLGAEVALAALQQAVRRRHPRRGLIHHSDRGSQYAGGDFQRALRRYGMTCSMSRKGNCWDNAPTESFFSTLKAELVRDEVFPSRAVAHAALFEYIELFYNRRRRHSALGYCSPAAYESTRSAA